VAFAGIRASETIAFMTQALLVMDVQNAIVARIGDDEQLLARLDHAIDGARRAGVPMEEHRRYQPHLTLAHTDRKQPKVADVQLEDDRLIERQS